MSFLKKLGLIEDDAPEYLCAERNVRHQQFHLYCACLHGEAAQRDDHRKEAADCRWHSGGFRHVR